MSDEFNGIARLFPLPDVVMFPHVVQPLYIFEPRYVEMLEDAIQGDQIIAMALLRSGWEHEYDQNPPIHETICIGRVMNHVRKDNGHYNILLGGLQRARIIREIDNGRAFREAEVELLSDDMEEEDTSSWALKNVLASRVRESMANTDTFNHLLDKLLGEEDALSMLVDVLAFTLPLSLELKQSLLSELDVAARAQVLIDNLAPAVSAKSGWGPKLRYPVEFSAN